MPHRAFRMVYAIDVGEGLPLIGPFATLEDARYWASQFCNNTRYTDCEVRPIMPSMFACEAALDDEVG